MAFRETETELLIPQASPGHRRTSDGSDSHRRGSIVRSDEGLAVTNEDVEAKKPPTKMRSSIACSRCRRSKIKCMNNGTNTTCRACATTGRECVYPTPTPGQTTAKRADASGTSRNDGETETKRQRKRDDSARKNSLKGTEDPFETPQLMPKLWKDVYGAFMLHCSAELPFLHEEQFHRRAQQAPTERSADTQIFLLGMLALTARFIPELASAHNINDPLVSSEFYADALAARLDAPTLTREPSLERVQGLLMISLYHWTTMRGQSAFMYLTIAIGYVRIMAVTLF